MKIVKLILTLLIALLSIAAGVAKVMAVPEEVQFLNSFGFNAMLIMIYGVIQIIGGVLFAIPKTIKWGAAIIIVGFCISTVLIILDGNYVFALTSLLPIVLAVFVLWQSNSVKSAG
ncbi:lipase maturation factor family protein [Thalassotalea sp. M1531]|uniref:Lipase maturation factor family protein n=1 Tax=Thalassotalea algicola TaxID=2716224 RepID=A0A7Y0LC72_9GAMM|nr:DoxX family protein [Thalassotalea algicola]NMP31529.1 lipase maturation factor family protein [Thalassotalea algicola]